MAPMSNANRSDISIGKEKWISFIEIDGRQDNAMELDEILQLIHPLLDLLETKCVAGCCGIDAYALWPEDIAGAAKVARLPYLSQSVAEIRQRITESNESVFVSHRLNNFFDKHTLLQLIDHIAICVCPADELGTQNGHPEEPMTRHLET